MIKKKDWEKRFAEKMNKEISAYKREKNLYGKDSHWVLVGIKDTLYLLGASINEGYKFANGWRKFCEDIGINIQDNNELGLDTLSKPEIKYPEKIKHSKYEDDYEKGIIDGKNEMIDDVRKLNGGGE